MLEIYEVYALSTDLQKMTSLNTLVVVAAVSTEESGRLRKITKLLLVLLYFTIESHFGHLKNPNVTLFCSAVPTESRDKDF